MNEIKSFTIYQEYYDLITVLDDEKEQEKLSLAIMKYMFEGIEPTLNEKQMKIFTNLKRPLDKSKKRSKASSNNTSNENQNENKIETNENQNENKIETNENQNENKIETNENQNENKTKTHQDVNVNVNVNVNNLEKIGYGEEKPLQKIIDYLNKKTNSNFRYSSKTTQTKIIARLNEGYTLDDFIVVIDKKCKEWIGTEFEKYLTPDVLFGPKFEKYLNQKITAKKEKEDTFMKVLKGVDNGTIILK